MERATFVQALRALTDPRGVLDSEDDMEPFSVDWRGLFKGRPLCVVQPREAAEVAAMVALCVRHGIAMVPAGGLTGLSGGATPDASGGQVVLSLARMNAIRAIDPIGETMTVEAGCILQVAQEAAERAGLCLPITLAAEGSAQVGGIVSTNAGGTNVLRYGMARARVLGLEVVTAQGELVSGLRSLRKDNAGYDWKQLFIGSEGTLGIVTAIVFQLAPMPRHRVTALLAVENPDAALQVLRAARQAIGETLNAFELMAGNALELVRTHLGLACPLGYSPWYVLVEASASLDSLRDASETLLGQLIEDGLVTDGVLAESERQEADLWRLRESITEAEARQGKSVKHDVSVPIARIPDFIRAAEVALGRAFPTARSNVFGHAGDGNVHFNVIVPPDTDGAAVNRLIHDLIVDFDGSISAEHGIGQYRVGELARCRQPAELALAATIKRALDPLGLMNPGKILKTGEGH